MRFALIFRLQKKEFPSDNRRIFMSYIKNSFEDYDKSIFEKYYKNRDNIEKPFTFSIYFGRAVFSREKIILNSNKIQLTFSSIDIEVGLHFYNSVLNKKGILFKLENSNSMVLERINLMKEPPIAFDKIIFKTLSPIIIREHNKEKNKDWYYSFEDIESANIIKQSLKYQAMNYFGKFVEEDINEVIIKPIAMKKLVILHYGVLVTGNVGTFEMHGKAYLLEYFYKAGISSRKSEGFGQVDILNDSNMISML